MPSDIVVIGGGPAGSTVATLLSRAGLRVRLFEREVFPRAHVGESLLPATLAVLDEVGVLTAIEAEGFTKKWGATMCWGRDSEPWSWHFRETNRRFPHAYQVWRPRFDQILLDHSRDCGVEVHEGTSVRRVAFEDGRAIGVELDDGAYIAADMVVDASGQSALLARSLGMREWDPLFRNLAVYGYFKGARHLDGIDSGNILIESVADGWLWKIPLQDGLSSIGAVVDREAGSRSLRAKSRERFLRDTIADAPHIRGLVEGAGMVSAASVVRDWSYAARSTTGPGYVLIGDAACFVDPLFSTGVHLAVSAAHIGAAYVYTALEGGPLATEAAGAFERLYRTQYDHFHELARLFYAGNRSVDSYFWEARRITGSERAPREAFVRAVSGQAAHGYERAVLQRSVLPGLDKALDDLAPLAVADVLAQRPRLARGLALVRTAVLGNGRFDMGHAVRGDSRVDLPVSPLVAQLVRLAERHRGARTVAELAVEVGDTNRLPAGSVEAPLASAAGLLLSDRVFVTE